MEAVDRMRLERRARILKSLAHPSRLLIIELLEKGPHCVSELTEAIGSDKSTVSKHLALLKEVGLVRDRKRGTWSDYELTCDCVTHLIDCVEEGMATGDRAQSAERRRSCRVARSRTGLPHGE